MRQSENANYLFIFNDHDGVIRSDVKRHQNRNRAKLYGRRFYAGYDDENPELFVLLCNMDRMVPLLMYRGGFAVEREPADLPLRTYPREWHPLEYINRHSLYFHTYSTQEEWNSLCAVHALHHRGGVDVEEIKADKYNDHDERAVQYAREHPEDDYVEDDDYEDEEDIDE